MTIAVCDANILIDLLRSGLLSEFLELEYENYAPPDVIEEVHEADRNILKVLKIVDTPKSKIVKRNRRCVYAKSVR